MSADILNATTYKSIETIKINTSYLIDCICSNLTLKSLWRIYSINETISSFTEITIANNSSLTQPTLQILNKTLKYGLYKIVYNLTVIATNRIAIVSIKTGYIRIIPSGFVLLGFESSATNTLQIGFLDTIVFIPVFYSFDRDGFINSNSLDYNFYCILTNKGWSTPNDFNQSLYSILPNVDLTEEQKKSTETCFKSTS